MFYMRVFKNEYKEKDDNKPSYSNSNFTVKEKVVLEPGVAYTIGLWRNKVEEGGKPSLNIQVAEKQEKPLKVHSPSEPDDLDDDIDVPY